MPGSSPGMTVWVVDSGLRAFPAIPSPPGRDRVGGRGVGDRGSEALGIDRDIAYRQELAQLQESAGRHKAAWVREMPAVDDEAGGDSQRHLAEGAQQRRIQGEVARSTLRRDADRADEEGRGGAGSEGEGRRDNGG